MNIFKLGGVNQMNFQDYNSVVSKFNGILKNPPMDAEAYKTHFLLIAEKITNFEVFKLCFQKHLETSDWFPSHIDLIKHSENIKGSLREKLMAMHPTSIQIKSLKKQIEDKTDEFIYNKDYKKIDILRKELFDLQDKVKKLEN